MIRIRNLLNGDIRTKWRRNFYDAGYGPFIPFGALGSDPSPVINWDFLQSQSLTSFSRTSNATLFDSTGKLTYAANNLLLNSATLSTQTVTTGLQAGVSVILSFSGTGSVAISGGYTGSLAGTGVSDRVSLKFTTTTNSLTFTVTGSVTSAQLEVVTYQTTPSTYNPTTTAPYYGPRYPYAYNGTTWDAQGLLVEAQSINTATYSQDISAAVWSKRNLRTSSWLDVTTAPDGTQTADFLVPDTTNGSHDFYKGDFIAASTKTVTSSVYLKASSATYTWAIVSDGTTGAVTFNLATQTVGSASAGFSGTIADAGNGWRRCSITATTSANKGIGVAVLSSDGSTSTFAGNNTDGIYVWGMQVEENYLPTSYIPNLATGTTTRNGEVIQITGTALTTLQGSAGTLIINQQACSGYLLAASAANNVPLYYGSSTTAKTNNNSNQSLTATFGSSTFASATKIGVAWDGSGRSLCAVNGTVATDANAFATLTNAYIGSDGSANFANGYIRSIKIWNTRLSDASLKAKTV